MRPPLRPVRLLLAALLTTAGLGTLAVPAAHAAGEPGPRRESRMDTRTEQR
ncbi:hypothetical protein [Streptomyces sp. NPDC047024]|uniref:hypothetical protein n=1 Tax=Streptomyces sp. NPDC047024 TaxID=3155476 RepID=UPI0033D8FB4A